MQLLVFGDIHHDWQALRKLVAQKADLYLCLGDLSDFGKGLEEGGEILSPLGKRLWLIPGNNETASQVRDLCQKFGFTFFHQKAITQAGFVFAGLGCSLPTPFNTPGEISEEEFEKSLKNFGDSQNLCLFTHNPPKNTQLDIIPSGLHVGSQKIREFINNNQPIYFFSGHIHESEGEVQRLGQTTCFGIGKRGLKIWL